jgi:hypothetical protein
MNFSKQSGFVAMFRGSVFFINKPDPDPKLRSWQDPDPKKNNFGSTTLPVGLI